MEGTLFSIWKGATKDGPGIRTVVALKGCPLAPVLDNMRHLSVAKRRILMRCPMIPGINDDDAEIKARSSESYPLPATEMAVEAGNAKVANILMMGALAALDEMPLGPDDFFKVLEQNFHGKALELNKEVFMTGYRRIKEGGRK
jgi:hypothetical protein